MCLLAARCARYAFAVGRAKLRGRIVDVLIAIPVKPLLIPFKDVEGAAQKFLQAIAHLWHMDSDIHPPVALPASSCSTA